MDFYSAYAHGFARIAACTLPVAIADPATNAQRVLEQARARGDDRKEVVGPLIQILIEQGEVPRAAAVALDIVDALSTDDAGRALATIRSFDEVLGVLRAADDDLDAETRRLLDERVAARAARDWSASDRLRDELADRGIAVEDTRDGQRWRRQLEVARG